MVKLISQPTQVKSCGNIPKIIKEYIGRVNSQTEEVSIAQMISPSGWSEPGQTPEFDEYTVVLKGVLRVKTNSETFDVLSGQAVIVSKGEWVQYSSPDKNGAEYIAVCVPGFSPDLVNRDGGAAR